MNGKQLMPGPTTALSWIINVRRGSGANSPIPPANSRPALNQNMNRHGDWPRMVGTVRAEIIQHAPDPLRTVMIQLRAVVGPGIRCLPFTHWADNLSADFSIFRL